MPVIINTGDKERCRTIHLIECPVCSESFEVVDGVYQFSATIGERVLVCPKHTELSVAEEVRVQTSLKKALDNKRGHVMLGGRMVKKSVFLEGVDDKKLNTFLKGI